jgi:hypothetical protein
MDLTGSISDEEPVPPDLQDAIIDLLGTFKE